MRLRFFDMPKNKSNRKNKKKKVKMYSGLSLVKRLVFGCCKEKRMKNCEVKAKQSVQVSFVFNEFFFFFLSRFGSKSFEGVDYKPLRGRLVEK